MARLAKSNLPEFSVDVFQNEFLPEGGREVHAVVTVTATGGGTTGGMPLAADDRGAGRADAAVVLMVDCSGSMDYPPQKLRAAREATAAAIDTIRDGVSFAVVAGTHVAREIFPGNGRLAVADADTRLHAKQSLRGLTAGGGTAISSWLRLTDQLLHSRDVSIRHGILLTDGRNEHEQRSTLLSTLDDLSGRFTCDCRGVGTDWEVEEVTRISSALLGSVDIVADPSGLEADFRAMMETAMGKEVADVRLRLWTPQNAEVAFLKQVAPTVEDLTDRRTDTAPRTGDYPTGSWGDESRDYHLSVRVPGAGVGDEMLAARVSLVLDQPDGGVSVLGQGLVRAVWTDDLASSTRLNPQVAHYTGQAELAEMIKQGLEDRKAGRLDSATSKLGRAVQIANASGNENTAKLLAKVVDVVDAAEGTVRIRPGVTEADEMTLETRSTKTVRVKK